MSKPKQSSLVKQSNNLDLFDLNKELNGDVFMSQVNSQSANAISQKEPVPLFKKESLAPSSTAKGSRPFSGFAKPKVEAKKTTASVIKKEVHSVPTKKTVATEKTMQRKKALLEVGDVVNSIGSIDDFFTRDFKPFDATAPNKKRRQRDFVASTEDVDEEEV